jgi:hypothetical protein
MTVFSKAESVTLTGSDIIEIAPILFIPAKV